MSDEPLIQYTIYARPRDYPNSFVVRRWRIYANDLRPDPSVNVCQTLEEARSCIPPGLVRIPRFRDDDPTIVEVWM